MFKIKLKFMKNYVLNLSLILVFLFSSCSSRNDDYESVAPSEGMPSEQGNGNQNPNQAGQITAGEWNDLENWLFWQNIMASNDFNSMPQYWSIYNNNRIVVDVVSTEQTPISNSLVELKRNGSTIFTAKTDNKGKAELWVDVFQNNNNVDYSTLSIAINSGAYLISNVISFNQGVNRIEIPHVATDDKIELAFVVDATGSMGDELEFLKTELLDVISRVKTEHPNSSVFTSSVFYRDEGDEYVTRISHFTNDTNATLNFIKNQSAAGGGDFPEAVHTALDKAINELQWSTNAKTRIVFLLLDAPPHYEKAVINDIHNSILKAAEKGIKMIPITASGIDKETEFLMRFIAISTNGTYVFITDDSGIGESHLQASVGDYQVELLNNLMVRLINKSAE